MAISAYLFKRESILRKDSEYSISVEIPNVWFHKLMDWFAIDLCRLERPAKMRVSIADRCLESKFGSASMLFVTVVPSCWTCAQTSK